ncbi:MAG: hypothetical protein KGH72_02020 [Candidatus Micrarchaeota archaeon]|nr:hypothetical protein [Candidatus Micrarchaeota archaeon]
MRDKIGIGIYGIDKMLFGGIPSGNQVILSGGPGSGKTLFAFEFLYRGALKGEVGILFSLEEKPEMILDNAKEAFGDLADVDKLVAEKKLILYGSGDIRSYFRGEGEGSKYAFGEMITELESAIESSHATRIVIDSISILKLLIRDPFEYRNISIDLVSALRRLKVTALITIEMDVADKGRVLFQPEFFIYDGIISMYSSGDEGSNRTLTMEIVKMRGSKHSFTTVPYEITPAGINVLLLSERNSGK